MQFSANLTKENSMNNITRFNPVGGRLANLDPFTDMDEMFNKFMMRPMSLFRNEWATEPQIRMDVNDADESYLVKAEIPGANKDDIHVTIEGNRVSISAEIKQDIESGRMLWCERNHGSASRSFSLSDEIDQSQVQAKYSNGLLELTLPKKAGSMRKQISIS